MMHNPSGRQYADELMHRLRKIGSVEVKRFFGGYGLVHAGVQFAFVMKGSLFFYVNDQTRDQYIQQHSQAFSYSTKSKQVIVNSYFEVPASPLESDTELIEWAIAAIEAARANKIKKTSRRSNPIIHS